ncbi:MAG: class I SAM-dependent methyltransferase [Saprospiraceae bacterium]|nr:class I SAM-dependent methyltransferase [Saprospiraceae bacterium]
MLDILPAINEYCVNHSSSFDKILSEIEKTTYQKTTSPHMLSGQLQGSLLSMISKMKSPEYILEIGTFTGYSAICLVQGLKSSGKLVTIDNNPETNYIADAFFKKHHQNGKIELMEGDAKKIIPTLNYVFDLVFIDADKESYMDYFDLVIDKCNNGALILADNVLWSGKIIDENKDKKTKLLDDFNKKIHADARVENIILPIRDGINLIRKI